MIASSCCHCRSNADTQKYGVLPTGADHARPDTSQSATAMCVRNGREGRDRRDCALIIVSSWRR